VRYRFVAAFLGGAAIVLPPAPAGAQVIDAGTLNRYNIAYRALPPRPAMGQRARVTIPIPLGLIQVLGDSTVWDRDSSYYNPVQLVNYILNPPLYLEVKRAPTPTNDVEFFIARNQLIIDLGASSALVPEAFELGGSSRPFNVGYGVAGFRVGLMTWVHNELELRLDDSLRAVLKDAAPVLPNSRYGVTAAGLVQGGIAPEIGWGGRLLGDTAGGLYAGAALRYLLGVSYARIGGAAGFTTGDTIFSDVNPLTEDVAGRVLTADPALTAGTGVGLDLGVVWAAGPLEVGLGVTDIGATITWSQTTVDTLIWDADSNQVVDSTLARDVESKTVLPVAALLSGAYAFPTGTVVRGGMLRNNRGTILSVGGEQRLGVFALRAGLTRDQRQRIQYTWGGGVRLGPVGLDLGFFTHSRSLSEERSITMATTLSIY
jgi:hypothetical protein